MKSNRKTKFDLQSIAERTHGFTGADLEGLIKETAIIAMKEDLPQYEDTKSMTHEILEGLQIKMEHFLNALAAIKPSRLN